MRPARSGSPSVAAAAGNSPWRLRMAGRTLRPEAGTCSTTITAAGRSSGRSAARRVRASTPPAEAPTTIRGTLIYGGNLPANGPVEAPVDRLAAGRLGADRDDV